MNTQAQHQIGSPRVAARFILLAACGLALAPAVGRAQWLAQDAEGWTILKPSADTRICYVSSSKGNDQSARPYAANDPAVGKDPFMPKAGIKPYKTLGKALAATREGAPDWILLKRGDAWIGQTLGVRNGQGPAAPFVISAYGPGDERPVLKHGALVGMALGFKERHDLAIVGIEFYAHTRDPKSPDFVDASGQKSGFHARSEGAFERVLLEDCCFRFSIIALEQYGTGRSRDLVIRRNLFLDAYAVPKAGASGLMLTGLPALIEENVFDHNGWYEDPRIEAAKPTIYNHNIYVTPVSAQTRRGTILRGNLILRGSSMGTKFVGDAKFPLTNLILDNNLYSDGEIGASLGGNAEGPARFQNIFVINNVFTDMGRTNPLGRRSAWGLEARDWDHGLIANNLFIHQANKDVISTLGIFLFRNLNDVTVKNNILHGLISVEPIFRITDGAGQTGVVISENWIEGHNRNVPLLEIPEKHTGFKFEGNHYVSSAQGGNQVRVGKRPVPLKQWQSQARETAKLPKKSPFPDPNRTLATYQKSMGGEPTHEAFFAEARKQSKAHWRKEYTAAAVNDYLRAGFGLPTIPAPTLPAPDFSDPPSTAPPPSNGAAGPNTAPSGRPTSTRSFRRGAAAKGR